MLQVGKIHLKPCQKHDVINTDLTEEVAALVSLNNIESVFTDKHSCHNHTNKMRNAELRENQRRQQYDSQHDGKHGCGIGDWKLYVLSD